MDGNTIQQQLQEVIEAVCDNLCKYRSTADDDLICDYIREHGSCPLDKIS